MEDVQDTPIINQWFIERWSDRLKTRMEAVDVDPILRSLLRSSMTKFLNQIGNKRFYLYVSDAEYLSAVWDLVKNRDIVLIDGWVVKYFVPRHCTDLLVVDDINGSLTAIDDTTWHLNEAEGLQQMTCHVLWPLRVKMNEFQDGVDNLGLEGIRYILYKPI